MSRKYFGTDGIRGTVGQDPLTAEFALRLASAAARVLAPEGGTVAIGKDTRLSGYMFESALEAGFVAAGVAIASFGAAAGMAHIQPVGRLVAGAGKTGCINKGFGQQDRMLIALIPIPG